MYMICVNVWVSIIVAHSVCSQPELIAAIESISSPHPNSYDFSSAAVKQGSIGISAILSPISVSLPESIKSIHSAKYYIYQTHQTYLKIPNTILQIYRNKNIHTHIYHTCSTIRTHKYKQRSSANKTSSIHTHKHKIIEKYT